MEIRVLRRADEPMVIMVLFVEPAVGEPGIERDADHADGGVDSGPARGERPMHAVMRDDEKADIEPALKQNKRHRFDARHREEHAIYVDGQPRGHNGERKRQSNQSLSHQVVP